MYSVETSYIMPTLRDECEMVLSALLFNRTCNSFTVIPLCIMERDTLLQVKPCETGHVKISCVQTLTINEINTRSTISKAYLINYAFAI